MSMTDHHIIAGRYYKLINYIKVVTYLSSETVLTILSGGLFGILASSGFWAYLMSRSKKNNAKDDLLLGIGCERIVSLGMKYIDRGWIYKDEYDTLIDYLWAPYEKSGGDGTAKRVIDGVMRLPIRSTPPDRYEHTNNQ